MKIGMWTGRLRRSVALGALLSATSAAAFAQQTPPTPPPPGDVETVKPPEEEPTSADVVRITGSRIVQDSYSSASAMTVVTADDAKVQGVVDIATLLQNSVAAAGSAQTTAAISSALAAPPGGLGTQTISLRGLGAQRTLILMNGRRAGPAGTGGSVGPFDLNVVPLSAIERVEILKDGASSLYGSDAIAGVINIITKTDSSSSIDFSYTTPEQGAGEELSVSATWGQEFDNGYFRISADYYHQKEFDRGDRDYFFCGQNYFFNADGTRADLFDPRTNDYTCRDDVIWGHNWTYDYGENSPIDGNGFRHRPWNGTIGRYQYDYSGVLGQYLKAFDNSNPAPSGLVNPAGWYPVGYSNIITQAGTDPIFDPYARNSAALEDFYHPFMNDITLSPEIERMSIVASGEIDLSDSLKAYGEVLLNRRSTREDGYSQIYTFQYLYTYGGDVFGDPIAIDNGWTLRNDPSEYYYVFLSPTAITDHADQKVSVDYMRVVGGLSGDFGPTMPGWTWDLSAQFSRSDGVYKEDIFWVDAITDYELRNSLCEGTVTRYRGAPCVDINWYSPAFNAGELTQEEQDFLYGQTRSRTTYNQTTIEGYMTGDLFSLPAGNVGAVFGFMYQDDNIRDAPAQPWLDQEVWDGRPSKRGITVGNDDTRAAYLELQLPLLKEVPLAKEVTLRSPAVTRTWRRMAATRPGRQVSAGPSPTSSAFVEARVRPSVRRASTNSISRNRSPRSLRTATRARSGAPSCWPTRSPSAWPPTARMTRNSRAASGRRSCRPAASPRRSTPAAATAR